MTLVWVKGQAECDFRVKGVPRLHLYTNWQLPHVMAERCATATEKDAHWCELVFAPMAADLGYHSPFAQYEGQGSLDGCPYLDGRPCYYDGSGLQAKAVLETLIREGGEAVWAILEARHAELFGEVRP